MGDRKRRHLGNIYSGGRIDRVDHRRRDQQWLIREFRKLESRVIPIWRNRHLVSRENLRPIWLSSLEIETLQKLLKSVAHVSACSGARRGGKDCSKAQENQRQPADRQQLETRFTIAEDRAERHPVCELSANR